MIQTTRTFDHKIQFFSTAKINKFRNTILKLCETYDHDRDWMNCVQITRLANWIFKTCYDKFINQKTPISNQKILIVGMFIFSLPRDFNNQRIKHDHLVFDVFSRIFVVQRHYFQRTTFVVGSIESWEY